MEFMRKFIKKPITWIAVLALVLVSTLAVRGFSNAGTAAEPTQTDGAQNATVSMDAADVADTATGNAGVSTVDVEEDDDAGANDEAEDTTVQDPSLLVPRENLTINQKLTWSAINSFPIKSADMTTDERRQLCVDFLRFAKTALWSPDESITYIRNRGGTVDTMEKGIVYGGLPYVGVASGSVYRLMDFIDESTGLVDISRAVGVESVAGKTLTMDDLQFFGNQCSIGAYWGWGRVINSADYKWTSGIVPVNNFIALGDYTNSDGFDINTLEKWDIAADGWNTTKACEVVNTAQDGQMYENYALLQKGDGLVYYTTAGHIVMVASDAQVEFNDDGTINPDASYVYVLDQAQSWKDGENASGDEFRYKNTVDQLRKGVYVEGAKWTFKNLLDGDYIPFTFAEFHLGEAEYSQYEGGEIEETEVSFSHSGSTITKSQLFTSLVTANYGISDVYIILTDDAGNEVYRHAVRTSTAGNKKLNLVEGGQSVTTWGTWDDLTGNSYNIEIVAQLGTGERPTVYVGTLIV